MSLAALRTFLLEGAALAELLGAAGGVHVGMAPEKRPRPYVVVHQLDAPRAYHHGGPSDRVRRLLQVESWADTREAAVALAAAVEARLSGYRGALTAESWCQGAFLVAERGPMASDLQDGGQDPAWNVQQDYNVTAHPRA